jgi:two-component system, LuxR family, sensor kinase FixL
VALGVIALWYEIDHRAHEHAGLATENAVRTNQLLIRQDTDNRLAALERLAHRWTASGGRTQAEWEVDAAHYVTDMPGFEFIQWIDATMQPRWAARSSGADAGRSLDFIEGSQVRRAFEAARNGGEVVVTEPFEMAQDGPCIAVFLPVWREQRFDGVIAGVLRVGPWLDAVVGNLQDLDHNVQILLQGNDVYRYAADNNTVDDSRTERSAFEAHGLNWTVLVTPTSSFLSSGHADSSKLVLIAGLLLSALVSVAVYLALEARHRSGQFRDMATQLATLFQNLPGMAYRRLKEPNGPMDFVSDGCRELSGYPRSEFDLGHIDWVDLIHPDDRARVISTVREAIAAVDAFEIEYRIVNRSGDERWVWERGQLIDFGTDKQIHIEGFISDVTDRKRAETALLEARAFSDAVVDTAADAVITIGAEGTIDKFNRAARKMFGYTLAEAQGKNVSILMPESYRSEHSRSVMSYQAAEKPVSAAASREVMAIRKDGSVFPIHLSISEIHTRPERKFVGLIRDISEQRAAENEARQHRENLAHVDRLNMLGEMATGIAHEINQPLTAISLFVQAGSRLVAAEKSDRLPEIFDKLIKHAHRASAVIERMQTMARRRESAKEVISCDVLIDEVAKLAEAEARIRDMMITVDTEKGLPEVAVDIVQIQQVLLNLLRNGMESMQSVDCRDGNTIGIQVRSLEDDSIRVAVIDRGSGVSKAIAETLFAPFSTSKKSGMGMGLSISRAIVIAHGGRLDFHNNDDGGATFFFTLFPAEQEE